MEKRKTGFGYGTKLDFTKHNTVTPAPNAYSLKSIFDSEKSKSMGITFGYGREVTKCFKIIFFIIIGTMAKWNHTKIKNRTWSLQL